MHSASNGNMPAPVMKANQTHESEQDGGELVAKLWHESGRKGGKLVVKWRWNVGEFEAQSGQIGGQIEAD